MCQLDPVPGFYGYLVGPTPGIYQRSWLFIAVPLIYGLWRLVALWPDAEIRRWTPTPFAALRRIAIGIMLGVFAGSVAAFVMSPSDVFWRPWLAYAQATAPAACAQQVQTIAITNEILGLGIFVVGFILPWFACMGLIKSAKQRTARDAWQDS